MSSLMSAVSPDKMDKISKLRATSGTTNIQQSSPLSYLKYRKIRCNKEQKVKLRQLQTSGQMSALISAASHDKKWIEILSQVRF